MSPVKLTGLVLPEAVEERGRSEDGRRAQFVLQPLERGFGHTLGNSVRRVLLSSLPGSAVRAFRADGVQHEHQSIEGVAEDVHQIVQNLKHLVLELAPDVDSARLELSVRKAGPVRARDITETSGVEFVDPDHLLFTLQEDLPENRPLRMELWVDRGRGFVLAEDHEMPEHMPVDAIRVDSMYNPVVRANFAVHETRVGQRTDFDRLTLAVETNGALDPADALGHAAEIVWEHLRFLAEVGEAVPQPPAKKPVGETATPDGLRRVDDELRELLDQSLEAFEGISVRSRNTLEKANIHTLADIAGRTRDEMLQVENFGEKSLEEVAEVLARHQLHFGMALRRDDGGRLYLEEEPAAGNGMGSDAEDGAAPEEEA